MKLHNPGAEIFVPDNEALPNALARTTHLGIGAHQDDLEIMAFHGIAECYGRTDRWFTGVTCTNGAGSPRAGLYTDFTDEKMRQVRREEQRQAAAVGRLLERGGEGSREPRADRGTHGGPGGGASPRRLYA